MTDEMFVTACAIINPVFNPKSNRTSNFSLNMNPNSLSLCLQLLVFQKKYGLIETA